MERIVVSGISGRFPQSNNITEFKENLMNKVYLVGDPENRIKFKFPGVTTKYGLMKNLDKFDYTAFPRVNYKLAEISDPQMRFISEDVNQAILDAGVSPRSLFGSNTGVYVGCFNYDSLEHWMCNIEASQGLVAGANMAFSLSNRISYMLGFHGPSLTGKN
jgi:fatty acid synthase, animal type